MDLPISRASAAAITPGGINARRDRLPATRSIWKLVVLISPGDCFAFFF